MDFLKNGFIVNLIVLIYITVHKKNKKYFYKSTFGTLFVDNIYGTFILKIENMSHYKKKLVNYGLDFNNCFIGISYNAFFQ